jgi:hypothetical protein
MSRGKLGDHWSALVVGHSWRASYAGHLRVATGRHCRSSSTGSGNDLSSFYTTTAIVTDEEFRSILDHITTDRSAALWWPDIQQLRHLHPHSISLIQVNANRGLNCFGYALGFNLSSLYLAIATHSSNPNVFADPAFIRFLLNGNLLSPSIHGEGLILYFKADEPRHAGIIRSDRVVSKWGTGGWYEHAVLEVPAQHGTRVEVYETPPLPEIERAFVSYARLAGARIEHILAKESAPRLFELVDPSK